MEKHELISEIKRLKKERNAVIVAHNYQQDDVQEIADEVGDSLALCKFSVDNKADTIVFCGVHFMAESAKILSPTKNVLLPEIDAGCPMADMVTVEALREKKREYPNAVVVCYVNSSAEVKAESDICCTSSNAVNIVKTIKSKEILFVPDKNLGSYVASLVPEKKFILWNGFCNTHHKITLDEVKKIKELHQESILLVHPECKPEVTGLADFVGSTKQIINYAKESKHKKIIVGTEMGIFYKLRKDSPDKKFYLMSKGLFCINMKKTSLQSVYTALKDMKYNIELNEGIRIRAKSALDKMLKICF